MEGEILGQEGPFRAAWPGGLIHASALPSSPWPHQPIYSGSSRPAPGPLLLQFPLPETPSSPSHLSHSFPTFPVGSIITSSEKPS